MKEELNFPVEIGQTIYIINTKKQEEPMFCRHSQTRKIIKK